MNYNNHKSDYIASSTDSDTNIINNEIKFKSTPAVGIITPIPTYGTIKNPLENSPESNSDNSNEIKINNTNTISNNNKNILTPQTSIELSYKSDMENPSSQYQSLNNYKNTISLQSNTVNNNNSLNINFKQPLHIPSLNGKSAFTVVSEDDKSLSSYNNPTIIKDGLSTRATYIPSISSQGGSTTGCEDMRESIANDNIKNNIDSNIFIQQLKQCTE